MDQERLALLKKIGEARFTCVELNLYLDTHPDDVAARADFNSYSEEELHTTLWLCRERSYGRKVPLAYH